MSGETSVLPGAFGAPPQPATQATPEIDRLVQSQVSALLLSSPAFTALPEGRQAAIRADLGKITGYTAALIQEDWYRTRQLGQTPMVKTTKITEYDRAELAEAAPFTAPSHNSAGAAGDEPGGKPTGGGEGDRLGLSGARSGTQADATPASPARSATRPLTRAPVRPFAARLRPGARTLEDEVPRAEEWSPRAASQVARVTEATLNAIAFPTFVADLIKGTFNAVIDASIQQMEAFGELLSNVAKTVDDYMADNITDNSARDWIVGAFPRNFALEEGPEGATLAPREDPSPEEEARMRRTLNLPSSADVTDVEEVLVPASRRHLAQTRQQMLSSMVLMGINRIIVTRGRIRAQMGFRIDTKDYATASASEKFDTKSESSMKYGWFLSPVKASVKTTVAYVSSNEQNSENEINVSANLTGEVDLQFKSDVFPLERFADAGVISTIQGNTANPAANQPVTAMPAN